MSETVTVEYGGPSGELHVGGRVLPLGQPVEMSAEEAAALRASLPDGHQLATFQPSDAKAKAPQKPADAAPQRLPDAPGPTKT